MAEKRKSDKLDDYICIAKDHIRKIFGCGLSAVNNSTLYETSSNDSNFFEPKSSSKVFLVGLSETYSKNYVIVAEYVKGYTSSHVKTSIDPEITDLSYNPNSIVKSITQQQKHLSETEIQLICRKYQAGASVYELAEEFGCHRRTISDTLKRNGIEVSHKASAKPELVKKIIELYAEYKTPKDIGKIVGLDCGTVRIVLKENGIYIRKSWEYPRSLQNKTV